MPKSNLGYWKKKLKRNVEKQKEDIKKLRKAGWEVVIIWECEMKDKKKLSNKLKVKLKQ